MINQEVILTLEPFLQSSDVFVVALSFCLISAFNNQLLKLLLINPLTGLLFQNLMQLLDICIDRKVHFKSRIQRTKWDLVA